MNKVEERLIALLSNQMKKKDKIHKYHKIMNVRKKFKRKLAKVEQLLTIKKNKNI